MAEVKVLDNASYRGNVKITLKNGDKPYKVINTHNAGTSALFNYLIETAAGHNTLNKRPGLLFMYESAEDMDDNKPILNFGIIYDTFKINSSVSSSDSSSVTFDFVIPATLISGKTIAAFSINGVSSTNNSAKDLYAKIVLNSPITSISDSPTNLDLQWTLSIGKAKVTSEV